MKKLIIYIQEVLPIILIYTVTWNDVKTEVDDDWSQEHLSGFSLSLDT